MPTLELPSVLVADDHPLVLDAVKLYLTPYVRRIELVLDGMALVDQAQRLSPDLIISDITMPKLNGIEAARRILASTPNVKFLFLTAHADPRFLEAALNTGAKGYALKSASRDEIVKAFNDVLSGQIYIAPELFNQRIASCATPKDVASKLRLSPRERQTLQLIAEGRSAKEIAHLMSISLKTVAYHRENIKMKLGLRTTAELTRHAVEGGLL